MNSKIWLVIGFLTVVASLVVAAVSIYQAFDSPEYGTANGLPGTISNINAAITASVFVGIGFVFVALGLIKSVKEKKLKESSD